MTTQHTIRVKLKRVAGLKPGDVIVPGHGLFTREGRRIEKGMAAVWGRLAYDVTQLPWMNDVPEMNVPLVCDGDPATQSILHTPLDAYVVLA